MSPAAARRPQMPPVQVGDQNLQRFLDAVRERLEVGAGERPRQSALDRYVTLRDLTQDGGQTFSFAALAGGGSGSAGNAGDATFIGVEPLTALTANAAVESVILSWSGTDQAGYAYTEVWRATVDDLGQAVLVGTTPAFLFADDAQVTIGTTYYYWIRPVSESGDPGAFNAVAGVSATPGKVDGTALANLAVDTIHVADAAIVEAKIAAAAIHSAQIANAAITFAKIADAAVDTAKIANAAITTSKIVNAAITTAKIANASITNAKIANAAVDTLELAGNAVTVPSASYTAGELTVGTLTKVAQSVSINPEGERVHLVAAFAYEGFNQYGGEIEARLRRGSTVLWDWQRVADIPVNNVVGSGVVSISVLDNPGGGSHVYQIDVRGIPNQSTIDVSVFRRSLVALGVKR